MDPTRLLKKQHREVEALFKQIHKTKDPDQCRQLMQELVTNLELHMRLEEEMFYPAMREVETKKAEEMVLEAYEEHGVAKMVMREIPNVDPEDERFHAKMTVFQELIEHHVEEEEKEMFKLAGKLDDEELEELGERMMTEAEAAMGPMETREPKRSRRRAA
jgi:hemerythrin superfamily protein